MTLVHTYECLSGSFSGFGCANAESLLKNKAVTIKFINKQIVLPTQTDVYDNKGRIVFIIDNKLFVTKK